MKIQIGHEGFKELFVSDGIRLIIVNLVDEGINLFLAEVLGSTDLVS
jgi:hypothetical protein